ncbi:efflux transporter outer membrane subunit [Massilia sp. 9096]|uniref:efflux transporter outer membrane subunit n=1 Tax=Massilia sp. 9096 TaxID=1500894 RepID=UPI0009DE0BD9|nr:efflux transporter outer membrane subunit [Massilia sp. 9096]
MRRGFVHGRVRGVLCAVAAGTLLAACKIPVQAPPKPTLSVPAAWHGKAEVGPNAGVPVEREWWTAFNDPVLNNLVAQALERNANVLTARARLQEYRARIRVAEAAGLPEVNFSLQPGRGQSIGPFGPPSLATVVQGGVQASYELYSFGRTENAIEAARYDLAAQQAAADAAALSVAANVATGYLNLRGLDAQLEVARQTLATRERSAALARREFEVGYTSRLEVQQSESERRSTAQSIPQLERAIGEQENALALLVGANPGPIARGTALTSLQPPALAPGLPSQLLRRRPDIAQAEDAVAAADAGLAVARAQFLPAISLNASAGLYQFGLPELLHDPFRLWSLGGSVLAPIFDAGRRRAQADVSASLRDRALIAYEAAVRNAFAETENALDAIERLREQLEQAEARRVASAEQLRIAHNRYRNGYSSFLEELDAQRNAFSADTGALQLRANYLSAHVDLYRALGGGWQAPDRPPALKR